MTIEDALTAYVLAHPIIAPAIKMPKVKEIDPDEYRFDFDTQTHKGFPAIVAHCISNVPTHTHNGQSKTESPKYQLTAYATTRVGARALAEQIKVAFCDYRGVMSGLTVQYITLINELPDTLTSADGTIKVHTVVLEFEIIYNRE